MIQHKLFLVNVNLNSFHNGHFIRNYSCIFSPTYDHHRVNANLKWHGTVAGQQQYYRVAASGIRNKLLHYT